MIKTLVEILFYALMITLGAYSVTLIYVLLRFGKSKVLGLGLAVVYAILILSLFTVAQVNFTRIPFGEMLNL